LALGRIDGRLDNSDCADIFPARARLEGAAKLAGLAGVPVEVSDLQALKPVAAPPPRASESLNDPISVAAVFHFAISRDEESRDPILRTTLHALRSVLDDRAEAETYAEGDLAHFGPMWRLNGEQADEPFDGANLADFAERVLQLNAMTETIAKSGTEVVAVDGRTINFLSATRDQG
jgi:hypothetical protein